MSILAEILRTKVHEVATAKERVPLTELMHQAGLKPPTRGFKAALATPPAVGVAVQVIAEVKKASPSKGLIRPDFEPVAIARQYEAGGAACLSVLTDEKYFQGSPEYLRQIRQAVALPLLRKDFIIDGYQVYEARVWGADAILLITAAFTGPEAHGRTAMDLAALQALARSLGLDVLMEVHDREEMALAVELGADLIGVNNRDLRSFDTRLETTEKLAHLVPPGALLVSESGINTVEDCQRVASAGAKAVLVGESLMRQPDPAVALLRLRGVNG